MKIGLSRFIYFTDQVKLLLNEAGKQKDPALWLFKNNLRTPFFMLEGLSRVYGQMHNSGKFDKLKGQFKLIEDELGQIDHYHSLYLKTKNKKQIPAECRSHIKTRLDESIKHLNLVLSDKNWLSVEEKRIKKITRRLKDIDWMKPGEEIAAIADVYKSSISGVTEFAEKTGFHFDNVENDVHELRRKLRWLSIYPHALQGAIQFSPTTRTANHLRKYMTGEVISSPFNQFPPAGNNKSFLWLRKNYFLALSWMIAQLGNLKDEGLILTGLSESLIHTTGCSEEEALLKAGTLLGKKQRNMDIILADAEKITETYFRENNLQRLISKIGS